MNQPIERRLAAILAADVAGYSRLMEADEEGTLERLKPLPRELLDPKITAHSGRIVERLRSLRMMTSKLLVITEADELAGTGSKGPI